MFTSHLHKRAPSGTRMHWGDLVETGEISFTRYFYNYLPPRSFEKITEEIFALEKKPKES